METRHKYKPLAKLLIVVDSKIRFCKYFLGKFLPEYPFLRKISFVDMYKSTKLLVCVQTLKKKYCFGSEFLNLLHNFDLEYVAQC